MDAGFHYLLQTHQIIAGHGDEGETHLVGAEPEEEAAAFTGMGLVSTESALISGRRR